MSHFNFKTLAIAAAIACPTAAQAFCTNGECSESFGASDSFGNSKFGAGYDFDVSVSNKAGVLAEVQARIDEFEALAASADFPQDVMWQQQADMQQMMYDMNEAALPEYTQAYADADIDATVFGDDIIILDVGGKARLEDGDFTLDTWATVIGGEIELPSFDSSEIELFAVEMTFFEASATYYAAGIPLTVSGEVTGSLSATGSVNAGDGLLLGITPNANLSAGASVSVGVACLNAGISGEVDLVNVDVPTTIGVEDAACGTRITLDSGMEMSTMDGKVKVFANACGVSWSKKLVSWNGIEMDPVTFIDETACF